jgi:hypothetical protein
MGEALDHSGQELRDRFKAASREQPGKHVADAVASKISIERPRRTACSASKGYVSEDIEGTPAQCIFSKRELTSQ